MAFKIAARTILQLGGELISSDGIAFYELVKNAFDARSKRAFIDVQIAISGRAYRTLLGEARQVCEGTGVKAENLSALRARAVNAIDAAAPNAAAVRGYLETVSSGRELLTRLLEANTITIRDTGKGMTRALLNDVYLKIGTPHRIKHQNEDDLPILGEKGLGRLSVMRLGSRLSVKTATLSDAKWNVLNIDWDDFDRDLDQLVGDIKVEPSVGPAKDNPDDHGTEITITGLHADWDKEKLRSIAIRDFARLTDPFSASQRFPVITHFNGELVSVPSINKLLLKNAHARVQAQYSVTGGGEFTLSGEVVYGEYRNDFAFGETQLTSIAETEVHYLRSLGPFSMELYWFNRKQLKEDAAVLDRANVIDLVKEWAGGLMVFRDGFRVNPYGSPSDDWLSLDPDALGAQGYKVNRRQIIGRVEITRSGNPHLRDQTNREGLRDCPEKDILIALLRHIIGREFRAFITGIAEEELENRKLDFDELERRLRDSQTSLGRIAKKLAAIPEAKPLAAELLRVGQEITDLVDKTQELSEGLEEKQNRLVHLAGLGLLLEILGHELHRITNRTLESVRVADGADLSPRARAGLRNVEAQLRTLEKRLRVLDPLSTPGRQRKESFDFVEFVRSTIEDHKAQFERHEVTVNVSLVPMSARFLQVAAVKGMFVQILENLISNSLYWLRVQKKANPSFEGRIDVTVDVPRKRLLFTDNGPGIEPFRSERVFEPFYTTKSAKSARGLGLYISREMAKYHGCRLFLDTRQSGVPPTLHTFILEIEPNNDASH